MAHRTALPGTQAPDLRVPGLNGVPIDLAQEKPDHFTLVYFYRGVHCPICKAQLEELNERLSDFTDRGLSIIAVSMDSAERAERQGRDWNIGRLAIGHSLTADDAKAWGLYLSHKEKDSEPEQFCEPGLAIVYPDGRIYALYQQSVPFARPRVDDLLKGLDFIVDNSYPARGTVAA